MTPRTRSISRSFGSGRSEARAVADPPDATGRGKVRRAITTPRPRARTAQQGVSHEGGRTEGGASQQPTHPSIAPRGIALGVTFSAPTVDRFNYDEQYLRVRIDVALGGRVAEQLVFGSVTTGAESDIEQLTEIAMSMVGRWGMNESLGPLSIGAASRQQGFYDGGMRMSDRTLEVVDAEVRELVAARQAAVRLMLSSNRQKLDALAEALLQYETLDEADAYSAAHVAASRP